MSIQVVMPRAGLTMVEGTIGQWKAAEGAQVAKGDVIMEYENEKNTIEYEALDAGILHILAKEGETIPVGGLIAELAQSQEEYAALVGGGAAPAAAAPVPAAQSAPAGVVEIAMPRAGLTMVEGTITAWKAAEGSQVAKGDAVMEYENEKNTIDYEIVHGGYLHIVAPEGETVKVGEPIAYVAETKEAYDALVSGSAPAASCVAPAAAPAAKPAASAAAPKRSGDGHVRASGLARKMAREAGIDVGDVPPSGGDGTRVIARDVTAYLEARKNAPAAAAVSAGIEDEVTEIPWTGVRKTIARNMMNSLQSMAQNTCTLEVDCTELLALREKYVADQEMLGCKITVNDLLCKMLGKVVAKHPLANATFDGKTLYTHKHVHLSVAVATEDGLMVPVVRNIDTLSLTEINAKIKDLAQRAKEKKLDGSEMSGGTFSITNVGMFPIDYGTPVINPPQTCICGFGRPKLKPAVLPDGTIGARMMMNVFLTFDHQVIDGLECGRIFKDLEYYILHPEMILA